MTLRPGCLLLLACTFAAGENWPQWRGPYLTGVSKETNLPVKWTTEENIAWKLPMPDRSGATPIIWGDHIFLNVAEKGSLFLWSVDRRNGTVLWKKHISDGDRMMRKQNMSSPSPVTDGTNVWVMTGTGILKCFGFGGEEVWKRDIQADYGRFGLNWGYASSPLLHEEALFVQVLHGMRTDEASYFLLCGAPHNRNYAETMIMRSRWRSPTERRQKQMVCALHNYAAFLASLSIAISLSETWNLPRLSVGGTPMARASSFSDGSALR